MSSKNIDFSEYRYFNFNDYLNKTNAKIIAYPANCDNQYIHCFLDVIKMPTTANQYEILNLFSNTKNIKEIFIDGNNIQAVKEIFLKHGFQEAPLKYVPIFISIGYNYFNSPLNAIFISVTLLTIPGLVLYQLIDFYLQKRNLKIHKLYGLSLKKLLVSIFLTSY